METSVAATSAKLGGGNGLSAYIEQLTERRTVGVQADAEDSCDVRPRVFLGCLSESLPVARAVKRELSDNADVVIWPQDLFPLSRNTLDELLNASRKHDYAIFILGDDDRAIIRGEAHNFACDNVVFEMGMFISAMGTQRTFFMVSSGYSDHHLLGDHAGLTVARYNPESHRGNLQAAVGNACAEILAAINHQHPLSGEWELYNENSQADQPNGVMSFVSAGDRVSAILSLTRNTDGVEHRRNFHYEGRYAAGQIVLSFEHDGAGDQIVGAMVLHLRANRQSIEGRTTFWHNYKAEMVTTGFELRRRAGQT